MNPMLNRILSLLAAILLLGSCQADPVQKAISRQLTDYPETRVLDIYKSFCQDNLGPEHLIANVESARNYLETELQTYREDLAAARYTVPSRRHVPVGDQGNYIRVDLSTVLDGILTPEAYLDAFVRSANEGQKVPPEQWIAKWQAVAEVIRQHFPEIPDAEKDLATLDAMIAEGHLIISHSAAFRDTYHPHYRIIARDIFEREMKPLIDAYEKH